MEYYEPKDLIGKSVYDSRGQKIGEVEKAVFLKDGKGALVLRNIDRIILMEQVQSVADIIIISATEKRTAQNEREEVQPKTVEPPIAHVSSPAGPSATQTQHSTEIPAPYQVKPTEACPPVAFSCPKCRHENRWSAKFCVKCGERFGSKRLSTLS